MIRKFEPRDLTRVMQLWLDGNMDAHDFIPRDYWLSNAEMVRAQLLQAELCVFEQDGVILGFAGMQGDYLAGIFVDKQHRAKGIGKQLLAHLKQTHPALTLNVYRRNRRALEFYRREGFCVTMEDVDEETGEIDCTMTWNAGGSMRDVVLFIGMSLDGFIAGTDGRVDWMTGQDADADTEDTYSAFVQQVDTVVMGWNTYHQITTELSPEAWPYAGMTTYVTTHRRGAPADGIIFTSESPCDLVRTLRQQPGKTIWICGGADVAQQLMRADLIDRYEISVLPTMLGGGVRLFGALENERRLRLLEARTSNGIARLIYEKR